MYFYQFGDALCCSWTPRDLPEAQAAENVSVFLFDRPLAEGRATFAVTDEALLYQAEESADWLSQTLLCERANEARQRLGEVPPCVRRAIGEGRLRAVNGNHPRLFELAQGGAPQTGKKQVHLLALGDVGSHMLIGLRLLGGDCISRIGICDLNELVAARWEIEANQIAYAGAPDALPEVEVVEPSRLFDCDVFIFAASAGVPPVGAEAGDVRMAQLEKNTAIISHYARMARAAHFRGLFCEVSDPVDPLAHAAWLASNTNDDGVFDGQGLCPEQIQGYGLGVMNARAAYYAKRESRFARFLEEGRVFGGHGEELVVADSIAHYDDAASCALTRAAIEANRAVRALGFKPYVAPAYSSGVLSILQTIRGQWHLGSVFLGGSYMGVKNRYTPSGQAHEILPLPPQLMARIRDSEQRLRRIVNR